MTIKTGSKLAINHGCMSCATGPENLRALSAYAKGNVALRRGPDSCTQPAHMRLTIGA